ncbi:hypothetical protein BX616_007406 [Lobosporangium transversale]|uniref:Mitochondrial carrier domain-containing protein n=1 Tax=Lobosporangium transversale TaxID=64571 RepID=A0A1Y2GWV5_9FUNG|nr:mitochondrial carrier domain-containing protein [Lobosporangium transversale]KAF9914871.1 hypothetical protein BX616_007406 [Lobosporangium transversale]ORZ26745.1 mitochondrial carrier domain-containing protein [Lobosporangium transversale]|eukprot:XP_021884508.1 mitochondrial carrier domain-containing protein [Lobosporangium transversale]
MESNRTSLGTAKPVPLPFVYQLLAGAVAGVTEVTVMYPLDLVKTRLQLQVTTSRGVHTQAAAVARSAITHSTRPAATVEIAAPYTSIFDCLRKIVQQEGALNLYRGALPPLLAEAPRRAIKFGANEQWGFAFKKLFGLDQFTAPQAGFVGSMAGATEAFFVTPFDLVKVRLQDRNSVAVYNGTIDCLRKVSAQEGIMAFYHGIEATVWRHATWSGIYFMTIQAFRTAFPERSGTPKNESMLRNFVAGTIGGIFGTIVNTPFDVVKTRIQNQMKGDTKYGWTFSSIRKIAHEEGKRALFKGLAPKIVRLGPGGGLLLVVFDRVSDLMRKQIVVEPSSKPTASLMATS